jgi:hypothetical protein
LTHKIIHSLLIVFVLLYTNAWTNDELSLGARGPFQIRNQFPLNLQFLSFTADNAFLLNKKDFRVSLNYSHANTFAQSPEIFKNLNRSPNRIVLTPTIVDQLKKTDGSSDRYIIDSGSSRLNLKLGYGITDQLNLELDIPYIDYHGGFLDSPIEIVHQIAGFPYASRSILAQNASQILMTGDQTDIFYVPEKHNNSGIGDIVLTAKRMIYNSKSHGLSIAARLGLKMPTGSSENLHGSGSWDYGIDLTASKNFHNSILSTNLSGVFPGEWKISPGIDVQPAFSWIVSYEYLWGKNLSIILQNHVQTSYLRHEVHSDMSKTIYEWTAGIKYDIGSAFRISFAITENYIHHNNTADFGFHIGISRGF